MSSLCSDPYRDVVLAALPVLRSVCRQAWTRGLLAGFNGNASLRAAFSGPAGELPLCVVTRAGAMKSLLAADDLSVLDFRDGRLLRGGPPSSETAMHLALYKACPETRAILHCHPPHLLALSLRRAPEQRLALPLFEADAYRSQLGQVPVLPPGSGALAQAVARAAGSRRAVWMERHGLTVHGPTLTGALGLAEELEQLARVQLLAEASFG